MTTDQRVDSDRKSDLACRHERGNIIDSRYFGAGYGTAGSRRIFCDDCRLQRWLDIEAVLALSQAELGMIPADAAAAIQDAADLANIDTDHVRDEITRTGHSLVGLLRAAQKACSDDAGQYIHFGATTQDIEDTGQSLEMREVLDELDRVLRRMVADLTDLAQSHAGAVALGRTHAQPALPMSFGVKVAGWVDELVRDAQRLEQMRPRVLAVQLFGGVGTMAGFGGLGHRLLKVFARRLGLTAPRLGWHVARDRVAEYVANLALTAATMGRIADEIRTLSRPEFGEVELAWEHGMVGSSTMPHKRNPEACEQVVALARLACAQVPTAILAMAGDHERDGRSLRLEWVCVPDVSHYCLAAGSILSNVIRGLTVCRPRLSANVHQVDSQVCTERLMTVLAGQMGKQSAYDWVYDRSQAALSRGCGLREQLLLDGEVLRYLTVEQVHAIFEPADYLGDSASLVAAVVADARTWLAGRGTEGG